MTPQVLTPDDVVAAAVTVEAALRPVSGLLAATGRPVRSVRPARD